jgi:DNA-binding transcriptional LysR family regulator
MDLANLDLLVRIAENNGLAAAGRELNLAPATVSERLVALEKHYGARLINRTTRSVSLTEEGRILVEGAKRLLAEARDLEALVRKGIETISGPIRISAPFDLGRNRIAQMLDEFIALHPEVQLDLRLSDGYVDIAAAGIDLALRYGNLSDSSLRARRLAGNNRIVCAAPSYLEKNGIPLYPSDLEMHNCLLMRFGDSIDRDWPFLINGKTVTITARGNRVTNDGQLAREWCVNGHGIAFKSTHDIEHDLSAGRLVAVLAGFAAPSSALQIVYPETRNMPRRVRALIDFLVDHFNG